jgi:hypothetical protein
MSAGLPYRAAYIMMQSGTAALGVRPQFRCARRRSHDTFPEEESTNSKIHVRLSHASRFSPSDVASWRISMASKGFLRISSRSVPPSVLVISSQE